MPSAERPTRATPPPRRPYHHGNLRQALVDMAVRVAEETGKDHISVREVARRLGVSSGAPFRHFPDRVALMTAVAEEATERLRLQVERALLDAPPDAMLRLKRMGVAFIDWALMHPTQFRLVSSRGLFDYAASARMPVHFDAVRGLTLTLVAQAQAAGQLPAGPLHELALALRAFAYGLVRMAVDGQLPQWDVPPEQTRETLIRAMTQLLDGLNPPRPDPS